MNDNDLQNEYTVSLSPWVNEYATPVKIEQKNPEPVIADMADVYKACQEEVLRRIEASHDRLGRSMKWKADAIREDLAAHKDNSYTNDFVKEVIALAEKYL